MIATLSGKLKLREPGRLIIATGGVGYEVLVPLITYYRMPSVGAEVELEIRQVVSEDALLLYGFASSAEKHAFDLLMGAPPSLELGRAARRVSPIGCCGGCAILHKSMQHQW